MKKGELRLEGTREDPIVMDIYNDLDIQDFNKSQIVSKSDQTVRLNDIGKDENMLTGRLEIQFMIDHQVQWGTVCDQGFDLYAAMLVCAKFDLIAHPMVSTYTHVHLS